MSRIAASQTQKHMAVFRYLFGMTNHGMRSLVSMSRVRRVRLESTLQSSIGWLA